MIIPSGINYKILPMERWDYDSDFSTSIDTFYLTTESKSL